VQQHERMPAAGAPAGDLPHADFYQLHGRLLPSPRAGVARETALG
jgi:hypothetical protein